MMPQTGTTSILHKITPITYNILYQDGDIRETYNPTSSTTTIICEIDFDDRASFLYHMLGYSFKSGNYLRRVLPERGGYDTNHYALNAEAVKFMGWTGDHSGLGNWPGYTRAQYAITFGAPLYDVLEDPQPQTSFDESTRFVVWSKKGAASNEKIPGGAFYIVNDALPAVPSPGHQPLNEVGIRTGRTVSLEAKWLDVPFVNYAGISALANRINLGPVTFDGTIFPEETVLFETWAETKKVNAFGAKVSDITFSFLVRQDDRTWNMFWRKDGTLVEASDNGNTSGNKLFKTGTLENLFKLG